MTEFSTHFAGDTEHSQAKRRLAMKKQVSDILKTRFWRSLRLARRGRLARAARRCRDLEDWRASTIEWPSDEDIRYFEIDGGGED